MYKKESVNIYVKQGGYDIIKQNNQTNTEHKMP